MSPPDVPGPAPGQSQAEGLSAACEAAAKAPFDPAVLARLANEFFKEVPAWNDFGQPAVAAAKYASDPGVFETFLPLADTAARSGTELANQGYNAVLASGDDYLKQLESLAGPALRSTEPYLGLSAINAGIPGLPGGLSAALFSPEAAFTFLAEARPLFEAESWTAFEKSLPALTSFLTDGRADWSAPLIQGAVTPTVDVAGRLPTAFLEDLRSVTDVPSWSGLASSPAPKPAVTSTGFDVNAVRRDFPILNERVNGRLLVWLDNAATTQKPQAVIDRLSYFYEHENSNVHRAAHTLAARSTDAYEAGRESARSFLNAGSAEEIVFVRGATEAINLVAQSWGRANIRGGDEIVVTWLEHHANIVPWQMLCAEKGAHLRVAPVDDSGQVILSEYERLLGPRTRLVSIAHVSNALGTVTPVQEMVASAHRAGARVLVDGAQAVSHMPVDVQALDCDFYVFSGHKVFGPTGIGVVYGKLDLLNSTPPWQGGGNMIADVTFERTVYQPAPVRFEAGTGNIADAVGLGAALDYVQRIGMANIARYEHDLLLYGTEALQQIPGLRIIGTAPEKAGVLSFVLEGFRTEDVGAALSREGIAVRAGHHCAQPILRRFGLESTVRPSLALYNTCQDIDALVAALWNLKSGRIAGPF